ncbi:MAG: TonB-dependent receptor [Bacteroidetes bacterium]|nr:TonB-dependent receptor [Bacteroidota bacterium]
MRLINTLTIIIIVLYNLVLSPHVLLSQDSTNNASKIDTTNYMSNYGATLKFNQQQLSGLPFRNLLSYGLFAPSAYKLKEDVNYYYGISANGNSAFVDGMNISDVSNFPIRIIDTYSLYTSKTPIVAGFSAGGITSIETLSDINELVVLFDVAANQAFNMEGIEGELFINIPLNFSKKTGSSKRIPSLLVAGKYAWTNNNDPVWQHTQKLSDEKLNWLKENPYKIKHYGAGFDDNSEFIISSDMVDQTIPDNNGKKGFYPFVKLELPISKNIDLTLGNYSTIDETDIYNRNNQLLNFSNNNVRTRRNLDNYLNLKHKIVVNDELRVSYNLNLQYSNYYYKIANPEFDNNFFDYGYVGKFTSLKTPTFEIGSDSVDGQYYQNVWLLNSWDYDTLVIFEPSNINSDLSNYTTNYFDIYSGQPWGHFQNMTDIILGGGLINGMSSGSAYGLFNNIGNADATYQEKNFEKFRAAVNFEVNYKQHHIVLGGEYNRDVKSHYSISPNGLWNIIRDGSGLTNFHLLELDRDNPELISYNGHVDTIIYKRKYDAHSQRDFDKNLRQALGLPIDGLDYILVDSYDRVNNTINYYDEFGNMKVISTPDNLLSLELFSAQELLNDGLFLVNYSGYDYAGNKINNSSNPYSFFDDFTIASSEPQYWAAFVQDEFTWKNLHVQLGLRVDVYDANQPVLKDEYSLFPIYNVVEASQLGDIVFSVPDNIGDDYVVYVNKVIGPTRVLGYRNNNKWFGEDGIEISDPVILDVGNGISPYLKYPDIYSMEGDWEPSMSFKDYSRSVAILPQISLDYTIIKRINIYTNYSSATQNPNYYSDFRPDQYYYFNNLAGYKLISNPALKPIRSGKFFTGVKAVIWKNLMADVCYLVTSIDNYIYSREISNAYPTSYFTVVNDEKRITTQGFEAQLNFVNQSTSGFTGGVSYTRLFPRQEDYTYKQISDMVINANVGYRFGRGENYKGTDWGNGKFFQGFSTNVFYQHRNGVPYRYTESSIIRGFKHTPNVNMININIQKDFVIGKKSMLNVYLTIENLFNFKNVFEVYPETGDAGDDGYLTNPEWQNQINNQVNPDTYRLLYQLKLYNPQHYDIPRIWRVGLTFRY